MPKTFTPELKKLLRKKGCKLHRQGKGDHEIWINPANSRLSTVDGAIKSRHTANKVLKDLGLKKHF